MAVTNITNTGILYPQASSWVMDYYFNCLSSDGGQGYSLLEECSTSSCKSDSCQSKASSWNRVGGFKNLAEMEKFQRVVVPCIYPFSVSVLFIDNLVKLKTAGLEISVVVLDPLVIGEINDLFAVADLIQVFDQRDANALMMEGIPSAQIELLPYPLIQMGEKELSVGGDSCLVFDVALGQEFRQVIVSSLYESLVHSFKLARVPSLSKNLKQGDFDNTFEQTIANRGLGARVSIENTTKEYAEFKEYFLSAKYCLIPGGDLDAMSERRALMGMAMSYKLPIVLESQRSPLSEYQGAVVAVEGNSEKIKGISLSKAYAWAEQIDTRSKLSSPPSPMLESMEKVGEVSTQGNPLIVLSQSLPRVLFKMRSNVFAQSGGDTVLLNRLVDGLRDRGFDVVVDINDEERVENFDLVHLFNFALKDNTEGYAKQCVSAKVPYLVTSLYEDWPKFFNQMMAAYQCFEHYIRVGQPDGVWEKLEIEMNKVPASAYWDNTYTASHAEVVLTTGQVETDAINRDYPKAKKVLSIPLGCEVNDKFDNGQAFIDKFGIKDFILCVGRLETRKNQLMLLKALEDTDHTIVFVANNFTYQPEYAELCRNFKRKGQTIFLERLSPDELASAYQAAKVHALPSWYELPGLVSLEAGRYGTNVVTATNGTIEDYLGEFGFYCNPNEFESIRDAVNLAYHAPKNDRLKAKVSTFTWERSLDAHREVYDRILNKEEIQVTQVLDSQASSQMPPKMQVEPLVELRPIEGIKVPQILTSSELTSMVASLPVPSTPIAEQVTNANDMAPVVESASADVNDQLQIIDAKMVKGFYQEALNDYIALANGNPNSSRVHRSLGVSYLQLNELEKAKESFRKALSFDQMDIKALLGIGAVEWSMGNTEEAYEIYKNAANLDSSNQAAVLYLVNSSYALNRLEELESVLREYLKNDPENLNIQYCLAGCYFKQEKYALSGGVVERILSLDETHPDAIELKGLIVNKTEELSKHMHRSKVEVQVETNYLLADVEFRAIKSKLEKLKHNRKFNELIEEVESYSGHKGENFIELLILKAEALGCVGRHDEAIALFREVETQGRKLDKVYCGIGAIRASRDEWKEAEALFIKALEEDGTADMPLCGLGMCAEAGGDMEDAWNYFIEASKRNPENIQSITGVIRVGYKLDRLDEVESVLKDYLELKPVDLYMLYSLAGCLYAQGRTDEAVKELRNILIFEPENGHANELLSEIEAGKVFKGASL